MKKAIKIFTLLIAVGVIGIYLSVSFILLTWNPLEWIQVARVVSMLVLLFYTACAAGYSFEEYY